MQDNDVTPKKENRWLADRSGGIFIFILSCGASFFTMIWPLREMLNHNQDVSYSTNTIALNVLGILFGLAYLLFGRETMEKLIGSSDSKGVARTVIFTVVFFGILFGIMAIWNSFVTSLGYGGQ